MLSLLFPALLFSAAAAAASDLEVYLEQFARFYSLVEREAADPVDPNRAIYEGAIPGLLRKLDPHSVFFTPGQFDQLRELEKSTSKGFGTVVSVLPGRVIVLQTLAGTPSARAGIEPGDEILAINGIRLDWLDMEQLVGLLTETRQREARLDVRRLGNARMLQFTLIPEELASPSVDRAFLLAQGVGYVRVASFEKETGRQLKEAIDKLGGESLKGVVMDFRGNPGGLLPAALEVASLFLPPGKKLLTVRGRATAGDEPAVPASARPYRFPLAILINGKSASAAEIVAGAMQDYDRAVIVGEPSYGKGLVQSIYPLSSGTGVALTTAFYFTPSGRSIQRPLEGGQLDGTPRWAHLDPKTEYRTESGRKVRGGGGIEPDHRVAPEGQNHLRAYLEASASFTSFATEYARRRQPLLPDFQVADALLDEFQAYLAGKNVLPGVSEWSADRDWIRSRLHQEILNQTLGVAKGDEIELRRDPQVRKAVELLETRDSTLKPRGNP